MLDDVDNEVGIETPEQFQEALSGCLQAKNALGQHRGYSPEVHVLGKCRKNPDSVMGDESLLAHFLAENEGPDGLRFRNKLLLREKCSRAFFKSR